MPRRNNNAGWSSGGPVPVPPPRPTEFEIVADQLHLTESAYVRSEKLRRWCDDNRNRCYVPEWLLTAWNLEVECDRGL